jgi:hypothetical protein
VQQLRPRLLIANAPRGIGGRGESHHGNGGRWGGVVRPGDVLQQRRRFVVDGRVAGASRKRARGLNGRGVRWSSSWAHFIERGR